MWINTIAQSQLVDMNIVTMTDYLLVFMPINQQMDKQTTKWYSE